MCTYRQKTPPDQDHWKNDVILSRPASIRDKVRSQPSPSTSGVSSSQSEVSSNSREIVRITSVTTLQDFTVQKADEIQKYEDYRKELQVIVKAQKELDEFDIGKICLVFHSFDQMWCRATILDSDVDMGDFLVTVACIDDGTTFSVTEKKDLKCINTDILSVSGFGKRCSLAMKANPKRENEATQYLMRMMNNNLNLYEIVNINQRRYVELFQDDINVTDLFVEKGIGKRMFVAPSGFGYINYATSLENFSLQMDSDIEKLNRIKEFVSKYVRRNVKDPKIGALVLARFTIDKRWYRARIVSKEAEGFNVYLIDYGHSTFVDEIGAIDDRSIAKIHPIAVRCSLVLPDSCRGFGRDAEDEFTKIAQGGNQKFEVLTIEPGEKHAKVELYIGGGNILEKLLPSGSSSKTSNTSSKPSNDDYDF